MTRPDNVIYLTPPRTVAMHDEYFFNADIGHFWIDRRFQVVRKVAGSQLSSASRIAEFGCGNGVVQRQVELAYGSAVDGFDLNEFALRRSLSQSGGIFCYDIQDRRPELHEKYDLALLLDVLEHIEDEDSFLQSLLFHVRPGGWVVINVPAGQYLFSNYDRAQGHCRRYSLERLVEVAQRNSLQVSKATYWGLSMVPVLLLRRMLSRGRNDQDAMQKGFRPPSAAANRLLGMLSNCERVPHRLAGTSVMILAQKAG